jgi:hypothetical protein
MPYCNTAPENWTLYRIDVFDDGLDKYKTLENLWHIVAPSQINGSVLPGKVLIEHAVDFTVKRFNISEWKLSRVLT